MPCWFIFYLSLFSFRKLRLVDFMVISGILALKRSWRREAWARGSSLKLFGPKTARPAQHQVTRCRAGESPKLPDCWNPFLSAQDRTLGPWTHTKRLEFDLGQIIEAREAPLSDLERIFRTLLQTFELCLSVVQIWWRCLKTSWVAKLFASSSRGCWTQPCFVYEAWDRANFSINWVSLSLI